MKSVNNVTSCYAACSVPAIGGCILFKGWFLKGAKPSRRGYVGTGVFLLLFFAIVATATAQTTPLQVDFTLMEYRYANSLHPQNILYSSGADTSNGNGENIEYPNPTSVMYKSMMIPGWGQIVNRQAWKVPIIYALFTGVGVYTYYLHGQYSDYRAAFYNATHGEDSDFRFGPTPEHLIGVATNELQANRNSLRNQRDFMFIVFGLAYGLNILDAYVFAHMRSFDVSDDLSARTTIQPTILAEGTPGLSVSFSIFRR